MGTGSKDGFMWDDGRQEVDRKQAICTRSASTRRWILDS